MPKVKKLGFILVAICGVVLFGQFFQNSNVNPTPLTNSETPLVADYNDLYGIENRTESQIALPKNRSSTLNLKYLAVFIKFSDSASHNDNYSIDSAEGVARAKMMLNGDELFAMQGPTGVNQVPSFKKYYETQSYGQLSITSEIFPRQNGQVVAYQDAHPESYYMPYSANNPNGYKDQSESKQRETALINNAVNAIAEQVADAGINATEIDTGNDGIIDAISFFIEGHTSILGSDIKSGDLLWSHKLDNYGVTATILGKSATSYNLLYARSYNEAAGLFSTNRGTYGTIIHEFGHTLGFADLYRLDGSRGEPVGFYDVMGNTVGSLPQSFLTYFITDYSVHTQWHQPLQTITQTTAGVTLTQPKFQDSSEQRAIKLQPDKNSQEFFVVEYVTKQNTYNTYTPDTNGVIVYRVNENNKGSGNKAGGDHGELDHVFVFRPEESQLGAGSGKLTAATLNSQRKTLGKPLGDGTPSFDNQTVYYANGANSGIVITVTSETADSVTMDITFPTLVGDGSAQNPYQIQTVRDFLYFTQTASQNQYYKLAADLDFQSITNYPAINFKGNLDGDGHVLKNITSSTGIFDNLGAYGTHTTVKNFTVENLQASSTTGSYLGGLASIADNVTIENVRLLSGSVTNVASTINADLNSTGGFVGNASSNTIIKNSSSALAVSAPQNVGGFIGLNQNATISDSFASGKVDGSKNVGGFIALQCIMEAPYRVPSNVYYQNNPDLSPVGNYAPIHNLQILGSHELGKGISSINTTEDAILNQLKLSHKNGYLVGFKIKEPFAELEQRFTGHSAITAHEIKNSFGQIMATGHVATGMTAKLTFNNSVHNYTLVVKGDVNGDGEIYANDYVRIKNHIMGRASLSGAYLLAADIDNDGNIYATDYVRIKNYIMGRGSIPQTW